LQHISASYEGILTTFYEELKRDPRTNWWDYGKDMVKDPDPGFLKLDPDHIHRQLLYRFSHIHQVEHRTQQRFALFEHCFYSRNYGYVN